MFKQLLETYMASAAALQQRRAELKVQEENPALTRKQVAELEVRRQFLYTEIAEHREIIAQLESYVQHGYA